MYIETFPNHNSRPAILLRESYRVGGCRAQSFRYVDDLIDGLVWCA